MITIFVENLILYSFYLNTFFSKTHIFQDTSFQSFVSFVFLKNISHRCIKRAENRDFDSVKSIRDSQVGRTDRDRLFRAAVSSLKCVSSVFCAHFKMFE